MSSTAVTATVVLWVGELHGAGAPPAGVPLWIDDLPEPAWHTDPLDDTRVRYWNGRAWSEKTMPRIVPRRSSADDEVLSPGGADHAWRTAKRAPVRAALFSAFGRAQDGERDVGKPAAPDRDDADGVGPADR